MLHISSKLKIIVFLSFILLLSGCEAEYNIDINNNNLKETINIKELNIEKFNEKNSLLYNLTPQDYLDTNLKWPTPVYKNSELNPYEPIKLNNIKYYTKTNISNYKVLGLSLSYNHNQNDYINSDILNKCYDVSYSKTNDKIHFETISEFKCFDEYKILENVTVNLNTKCNVENENSDNKNINKYTWYITKDNYKSKKINFDVECIQKTEKKEVNEKDTLIMFIILYILVISLIILIVKILHYKNNKI